MPIYDFSCEQGHCTEQYADYVTAVITCPICGQDALRHAVSGIPYLNIETGPKPSGQKSFPTSAAESRYKVGLFKEASAEIDHAYHKREQETGVRLREPPYYRTGIERASERLPGKIRTNHIQEA